MHFDKTVMTSIVIGSLQMLAVSGNATAQTTPEEYLAAYWGQIDTVKVSYYVHTEAVTERPETEYYGEVIWATDNSQGKIVISDEIALDGSDTTLTGAITEAFVDDVMQLIQFEPRLDGTYRTTGLRERLGHPQRIFQAWKAILHYYHSILPPAMTWHEVIRGEHDVTLSFATPNEEDGLIWIEVVPEGEEEGKGFWTARVALDPSRGYLPVKRQTTRSVEAVYVEDIDVLQAEEVLPGLWYPTMLTRTTTGKVMSDDLTITDERFTWTTTVTFSDIRLNEPLTQQECRLTFPVGTEVTDMLAGGISYTVEAQMDGGQSDASRGVGIDFDDVRQARLVERKLTDTVAEADSFGLPAGAEVVEANLSSMPSKQSSSRWSSLGWGLTGAVGASTLVLLIGFGYRTWFASER